MITASEWIDKPDMRGMVLETGGLFCISADHFRCPPSTRLLPRPEWRLETHGGLLLAGIFIDSNNTLFWVRYALSDLPNDLICLDDLEDAS